MKQFIFILLYLFPLLFASCSNEIKIACVGDSITEGYGLARQSKTAYPVVLDSILGLEYDVLNSGRSATTLRKQGDFPFWICKEFSNIFIFKPDIIIIQLGTNDTKPHNWQADSYKEDYQALIDTFKTIPTKPEIYLCFPVPVFKTKWGINDSTIINGIIPIIKKLALKNNLHIIDLHQTMLDQGKFFPDGIHPNEEASRVMAEIIAKEIDFYFQKR